jgi:hypothetical protein
MTTTHITEAHRAQFQALTSGEYRNFALFSCFLDSEPTAAIVAVRESEDGAVAITPLFVAVTDAMLARLTDHDGHAVGEGAR